MRDDLIGGTCQLCGLSACSPLCCQNYPREATSMSSVDAARMAVEKRIQQWEESVFRVNEKGQPPGLEMRAWGLIQTELDALIAAVRAEAPPQIEFPTYERWIRERKAENTRLREALALAIVDVHTAYCSRPFALCERCAYARDLLAATQPKGDER